MNPILLDTHAAMWAVDGTLAKAITKSVDIAAERGELLLSPITAWEIGLLARKGRLAFGVPTSEYVRALFARPGILTATLTADIAFAATQLPGQFNGDPADCILIATAAAYSAHLLTRDRRILEYAKATKFLYCIAC